MLGAREREQCFEMLRMREHVECSGSNHVKSGLREEGGIARERAYVAGNIHYPPYVRRRGHSLNGFARPGAGRI